jgi:hypothetical protein
MKTFVAYIKKLNSKFEARNPKQIQNFDIRNTFAL